ncbi:MAG: outer membrane beta-barrel protein [Gemmatimonadetes bacterium]|nr:outer membrane beta-barrel protein [Gemmatimonadota bacterium]
MRVFLYVLAALTLSAAPLPAQREAKHEGFWIGFGVGAGSDLSDAAQDTRGGGAVYLRLGGTINPMLLVGGEISGWARRQNNTTLSRGNVTGTIYFYPVRRGFFLKSGLGFATRSLEAPLGGGTLTLSEKGFGVTVGGGYDVQIGGNLFLVPNLDFLIQVIDDNTDVISLFTVGLTWH